MLVLSRLYSHACTLMLVLMLVLTVPPHDLARDTARMAVTLALFCSDEKVCELKLAVCRRARGCV